MKPSEKLLQKIREREVRPLPRWRFTLRNSLILSAFLVSALLGALAFSVILFAVQQTDFNVVSHLSHSRLELFLGLLPIFWIVLLVVFLLIAIYSIQYSPKGYKLSAAKLVGYSAALSILLGTLFFVTGGAQRLEHAFAINLSLYESINEKKVKLWSMPEEGYLSGEIQEMDVETFRLKDFNGKEWTIYHQNAFMPPVVLLERGEKLKLMGEMKGEGEFVAREIRPWGGFGGGRGRGK